MESSRGQSRKNQGGKNKRRKKQRKRKKARIKEVEEGREEEGNPKKERIMGINKIAEEQEIWNKKEEVTKSEEKAKKLVPSTSEFISLKRR